MRRNIAMYTLIILVLILTSVKEAGIANSSEYYDGFTAAPDIDWIFTKHNEKSSIDDPCLEGKSYEASTLCAQWRSTYATEAMSVVSRRTYYLNILGLISGAFTFIAAFAAAKFARDAAIHTRRSADTAERVQWISERPYLSPHVRQSLFKQNHEAEEGNSSLIQLKFLNFSGGIAKIDRVKVNVEIRKTDSLPDCIDPTNVGGNLVPHGIVIGPSSEFWIQWFKPGVSISMTKADDKMENNSIFIFGFIRYSGSDNLRCITGFCATSKYLGNEISLVGGDDYNFFRLEESDKIPMYTEIDVGGNPLRL